MAKTKTTRSATASGRAGSRSRAVKKTEEELPSDVEAEDEVAAATETGDQKISRRGGKTAKKKAPASKVKEVKKDEPEEPKGKKTPARNAVELQFSKSDESAEEESTAAEAVVETVKESGSAKPGSSKGKRGASKTKAFAKKRKTERKEEDEGEEEEDEEREYEVERILDVHTDKNKNREFLIKWKGFPISNSTWEPEENLDHAKDLVKAFLEEVRKLKEIDPRQLRVQRKQTERYMDSKRNMGVRSSRRFIAKPSDLSRTRRLSTIQNTKSSTTSLKRAQQGRVTKSRSRTPGRRSVSKTEETKLTSMDENVPFKPSRREPANGNLAIQKFMRESVERKLELLKEKERPRPDSTPLGTVQEEGGEETRGGGGPKSTGTTTSNNRNARKKRFGFLAGTALACGAAAASAAALFYTSPEALNWEHISPQVQQVVQKFQEQYLQIKERTGF